MNYLQMQITTRITIPILYYINLVLKGQFIAMVYSFLISGFMTGIIIFASISDTFLKTIMLIGIYGAIRLLVRVAFCKYRKVLPSASIWTRAERIPAGSGVFAYSAKAAEIMDQRIRLFIRKGYL